MRNVGRRTRELTLAWTSWYSARKYCEAGRVPVEGSEVSLRNWTMEELAGLDCSERPETCREDLSCREDFFGYLDEAIDGAGGCSEIGPGGGRSYYTYEECVPYEECPAIP